MENPQMQSIRQKVDMIRCLKPIGRPNTGTEMFMEERL